MSLNEGVKPLEIPLQDLLSATNSFAKENRIGSGGFGTVYKGESEKYGTIAIKRLDPDRSVHSQGDYKFKREIALLSIYKHENIVTLVGFCNEDGEKILVYKYESNQSLDKHLRRMVLSWTQRLRICLGAALGLKYLHHDVPPEHRIIHRDVKSANILLDENLNAKISDFGLCKEGLGQRSFVISNACGTPGYIDPDYVHTGHLTQKSDVFSFGIVLFEVLCGVPAFLPVDGQYFYVWVQKHYKRKTLDTIIQAGLHGEINTTSLATFSAIAYQCLSNGEERPTMKEIVEQLQKALDNQLLHTKKVPSGSSLDDENVRIRPMLSVGMQKQLWEGYKNQPNLKVLVLSKELITWIPDFEGFPCLEQLILKGCIALKEIHPSIGYHERLVLLDMAECTSLSRFPPIIRMRKLETLNFSYCAQLAKFPEIKMSMNSLVELRLNNTPIEIVPLSVGRYCTNLVSFDSSTCHNLKRIEGNFRLLERLKHFHLYGCPKVERLVDDFFDAESRLEVLSLGKSFRGPEISFKSFKNWFGKTSSHQDSLSTRLPQFPRLLKKLDLRFCDFEDGDIPTSVFDQLLTLQELDLRVNNFSHLPSLSRLVSLKCLYLSYCYKLVEIPDLPSSIAVLEAFYCSSLEQVGDLSIYKCLWKVSFRGCDKFADGESVVRTLLQETAVRNNFMSALLPPTTTSYEEDVRGNKYTLQLPQNWYNNFSGFLLCLGGGYSSECRITIEAEETCVVDSQLDDRKEFDRKLKLNGCNRIGYVPFASLMHTSWWNPSYNNLSFYFEASNNRSASHLRVELIPKSKEAIDCSRAL